MATNYEHILVRQEASFEKIKQICTNYRKDTASRKTLEYLISRLEAMDSHWQEFEENHELLCEIADKDISYFKDDIYKKLKTLYEETKQHMLKLKQETMTRRIDSTGFKSDFHFENKLTSDGSDQRSQNLLRQQECNFKAFERVYQKINLDNLTEKWEFEESLNMLKSKWERVEKLNWELDYALSSPNEDYEQMYLEMETKYDNLKTEINRRLWNNTYYEKSAPTVQLPEFSGNYSQWTSFKDLFVETIHSNPSIPKAQKMQHLKSKLTGEAERLIRHLKTSAENYDSCWDILQHRFDNRRLMCTSYMNTLVHLPVLQHANAFNLKKLHDVTLECLNGLNNMGVSTDGWDPMIVFILCQKLDTETYNDYISKMKSPRDPPQLEEFIMFLESRFIAFEGMRGNQHQHQKYNQAANTNTKKNNYTNTKSMNFNKSFNSTHSFYTTTKTCPMCKTDHVLMQCDKFLSLPIDARNALVTKLKLCKNCLYSHGGKRCTSFKTCRVCQKYHHTQLHQDTKDTVTYRDATQKSSSTPSGSRLVNSVTNEDKEVLLTTMLLQIKNIEGEYVTMRALLDQGSQVSLLTENAAQLLRIPRQKLSAVVSGIGTLSGNCKASVKLDCKSINSDYTFNVEALIINKLISRLPSQTFDIRNWEYLEGLKLADPTFNIAAPVDILLGADIYSEIILDGIIKTNQNYPIIQQTKAGWILSGNVKTFNCFVTLNELQEITKFWESEEIIDSEPKSDEGALCESHYIDTTERTPEGKYLVKMPMKPNYEGKLGKTRPQALAQFFQLERKMANNVNFATQYKNFMREYLTLGHMTPVTISMGMEIKAYLPHHGVVREESTTTKLRVVFNASMPSSSKYSLNDLMYAGPNLQKDMLTLMINWRVYKYVFTADVEKMYRNILIHECQQGLQCILWREKPQDPIQEMKLCTVTYGTKAAPYLAMRTLQQLAQDEGHNRSYAAASEVIKKWFYMDDLIHGEDSIEVAKQLIEDLITLMGKGGFNLRKWASNEAAILKELPEDLKCHKNVVNFKSDQSPDTKTLGIGLNSVQDNFTFNWTLTNTTKPSTKRSLLSDVSKLYDPLGWLAPITIKAKLLFQKLWVHKISWDDELPQDIAKEWEKLRKDLPNINKIFLRRWLHCPENDMEVHGFSDASEKAYACAVYSRTKNESGEYVITLIAAKTKVAPCKTKLTLPRLELCGALLLTKLIDKINTTITKKNLRIFCWSDSQVVLAWLQGSVTKWEKYVANRVQQITNTIPADRWYYVKSCDNAADCATRGLYPSQLTSFELWWQGPQWLKTFNSEHMDKTQNFYTEIEKTIKSQHCLVTKYADDDQLIHKILQQYSSLARVIRVVSWIRRFITNIRSKQNKIKTILTKQEMNFATDTIIKNVQEKYFGDDMEHLRKKGTTTRKSKLLNLTPFLDENGILRVKGRLQHSILPENTKHPIILPNDSKYTKLIIDDAHKKTLHGGVRLTLAYIRQKYWVIGGSRTIKKHLRLCVKCLRFQPHKSEQIMADLPRQRVTPSRPFTSTGIDFTSHVELKINKGKGVKTCKGYIAIFICMVTKAVHLELVSDMSTPTFLAALKRMCARRGMPRHIFSDNGTNFRGAAKRLQEDFKLHETFTSREFQEEISQLAIEWHFNAPIWPTAGGLWEAAVKSMKFHLKRVLGEQKLTYEQFITLLATIESCLNSRPLLPLSEDVDDLEYLTPGHFLIGGPIHSLPHDDNDDFNKFDLRNRWRLLYQMNQHIWRKWSSEYLILLQTRSKWQQPKMNLEKGKLVLIKDDHTPPGKWSVGRVLETHPGADGFVRVVTLKTKGGELKRPITKLIPFPEQDDPDDEKSIPQNNSRTTNCHNENSRRATRVKPSYFSLFAITLLMCFANANGSTTSNYKITSVEKDHPIYYDEIGNLQLIHDEWTLLVYYNLTVYWHAERNINIYVTYIENICKRITHEPL